MAPLFTAWCAVNRLTESGAVLGPEERISVEDAIHAITLGAAYTLRMDHLIGSVEPGKYADFAVLEASPFYTACLLYTSPSPRDRYGSRMPSSA